MLVTSLPMMNLLLVTWLACIITHTEVQVAQADIFTSVSKMKEIFSHENRLLSGIKLALKDADATSETQEVLRFCQERQERLRQANLNVKERVTSVKHPNGAYIMIKHFVEVYRDVRQTIEKMSNPYLEMILQDIPSNNDLHGARLSLIRLQEVYGLDPEQMVDGNYSGHRGPLLDVMDSFNIGLVAFQERNYDLCIPWFEITRTKLAADDTIKDPSTERVVSLLHESRAMTEKPRLNTGSKDAKLSSLLRALNSNSSQKFKEDILDAEMKKVHSLCAKMDHKYPEKDTRHTCRYKPMLLPYYRIEEETVSSSPHVSIIYNISTSKQSLAIQKLASRQLFRANVEEVRGANRSDYRTSHVAFLGESDSKHLSVLTRRIKYLTGLHCVSNPKGHRTEQSAGEKYQVVNYGMGGHYSVHLDTYEASFPESQEILKNSGNRILTVLIYLSKVEFGGSTVFPWLNIAVPPLQHSALVWHNVDISGTIDFRTRHAGCPVMVGDKWVMNKWILSHANMFQRPCGRSRTWNQRRLKRIVKGHRN